MFTKQSAVLVILALILLVLSMTINIAFILSILLWLYLIYFMAVNTPDAKKTLGIKILWILGVVGLIIWSITLKPSATAWTN